MTIKELRDAIDRATNIVNYGLPESSSVLVESEAGEFDSIVEVFVDGDDLVISTDR